MSIHSDASVERINLRPSRGRLTNHYVLEPVDEVADSEVRCCQGRPPDVSRPTMPRGSRSLTFGAAHGPKPVERACMAAQLMGERFRFPRCGDGLYVRLAMRAGVLTGGGDVPGLNACIKAVVNRLSSEGHDVVGVRRGWGGLVAVNPEEGKAGSDHLIHLTPPIVRTVDRTGGTFLHTSRTNPGKVRASEVPDFLSGTVTGDGSHDLTQHILRVLEAKEIDVLIPIGGDDTLSYAFRLHQEGVPVIAIPKTMDNDVHGTDYCIGFSTAVTRGVDLIHRLRTAAGSHERIAVVELFGR